MEKKNYRKTIQQKSTENIKQINVDSLIGTIKVNPLGGVHLYNEKYERHLNKIHKIDRGQPSNKSEDKNKTDQQKQYSREELYNEFIEGEISSCLSKKDQFEFNNVGIFSEEIRNIISSFKNTQLSAAQFLEEMRIKNIQENQIPISNFGELFDHYKELKGQKYSVIVSKIYYQFKQKMIEKIDQFKAEQVKKQRQKRQSLRNFSTQTFEDNQHDVDYLRKALQQKESEYQALYEYKKNCLNEGQALARDYQITISTQINTIQKMQAELKEKNNQIKNIQIQNKATQQRLMNKITELQKRQISVKAKSDYSNIEELIAEQISSRIPNNFGISRGSSIMRKNKYKQRAESILSVTQSLFGRGDDLIASMVDFGVKSLRDLSSLDLEQNMLREGNQRDSLSIARISKNSYERKSLFKILQKYLDKDKIKKGSLGTLQSKNSQGKSIAIIPKKRSIRNSSKLGLRIQKQILTKNSRFNNSMQETKSFINKVNKGSNDNNKTKQERLSNLSNNMEQKLSKTIKKQISFQTQTSQKVFIHNQNNEKDIDQNNVKFVQNSSLMNKQTKSISKPNILNSNKTRKRQSDSYKKLKKGVSFLLEKNQKGESNMRIFSNSVNICIFGKEQSNHFVTGKLSDRQLSFADKSRFDKEKLLKKKIIAKSHHKVISMLDSETLDAYTRDTPNGTIESITNSKKKISLFQHQQRLSHHGAISDKKFNLTTYNQLNKNAFAKKERETFDKFSQNDELQKIKKLASKCKNKEQYSAEIQKIHIKCGANCQHIKKYVDNFQKFRESSKKQMIKLSVQNLNNHIRQSFPALSKMSR